MLWVWLLSVIDKVIPARRSVIDFYDAQIAAAERAYAAAEKAGDIKHTEWLKQDLAYLEETRALRIRNLREKQAGYSRTRPYFWW